MWRAAAGRQSCGVWVLSFQRERVWTFSPLGWKAASMSLAGAGRMKRTTTESKLLAQDDSQIVKCSLRNNIFHLNKRRIRCVRECFSTFIKRKNVHNLMNSASHLNIWTWGGLCRPWAGDWRPQVDEARRTWLSPAASVRQVSLQEQRQTLPGLLRCVHQQLWRLWRDKQSEETLS